MKPYTKKGFTLLEILLVIALLAVLFATVLYTLNPSRIITEVNDNKRKADALTLYQAIEQYALKTGAYPTDVQNVPAGSSLEICKTGAPSCTGKVNLSVLVPNYIASIPSYSTDINNSGFYIVKSTNGKIGVGGINSVDNTTFTSESQSTTFTLPATPVNFAKRAGGSPGEIINTGGMCTNSDGSSIVTGLFQGNATFAPGETNQTIRTSVGSGYDIFVAKYNIDGSLAWVRRDGGNDYDISYGISCLPDGSSITTGYISGTAVFGQGETNQTTLNSIISNNTFIAKYNANGTLAWAKGVTGSVVGDYGRGYGISTLSDGTSISVGYFQGTATFGPGETNQTILVANAGNRDAFIAKYNTDGTLAWARKAGGTDIDDSTGVSMLNDGSSIIIGAFYGNITLGQGEANQTILTNTTDIDGFIAKYNTNGTLAWARKVGGIGWDGPIAVRTLPNTDSLIIGNLQGTATFGPGETNQTILSSSGGSDIFIAKYSDNGSLIWAKKAGGLNDDSSFDIMRNIDGSSIITGQFNGTATFGPGETNQTILTSSGSDDVFIAKYNTDGTLAWARRAGGMGSDRGIAIGKVLGGFVIAGDFNSFATFGIGGTNQISLTPTSNRDMYIARYNYIGTLD